MKEEEILEGNKLIAEFMGMQSNKDKTFWYDPLPVNKGHDELKYHSSWDWQIPVWSKIVKISREYAFEETSEYRHNRLINKYENAVANNNPLAGFKILIEFITWYNKQK